MSFVLLGILNSQAAGEAGPPAFLTSAPAWFDAADDTTITESGGSVSQWDNKGTLENLTQGNASLQPSTGVATINGLNTIRFERDRMAASTNSNWTFMSDGTTYFYAIVLRTPSNETLNFYTAVSSADVGAAYLNGDARGYARILRGVGGSFLSADYSSGDVDGTVATIYSGLVDPDSATVSERAQVQINDGTTFTNSNNVGVSGSSPENPLTIGVVNEEDGDLGELIIVSGADATEANRQKVISYLNAKWSVF